jgi:transposase-like protein
LNDFLKDFPDEPACLDWLVKRQYPDGIFCDRCGRITKHHRVTTRRCYSCDRCGSQVYPTAGTIFHKSRTPLVKWFYAVYLMSSSGLRVPARQLQRELGVTYKTAWRMAREIRNMLRSDSE